MNQALFLLVLGQRRSTPPEAVPCAGSLADRVLQGRGAQPRCSDARERNCKSSSQVCRSKVQAVAVLHRCCRAPLPSRARGWEPCGRHGSQPNSRSLHEARQSPCPIPCVQPRFAPRCLMLCCRLGLVKAEESVSCVGTSSQSSTNDP